MAEESTPLTEAEADTSAVLENTDTSANEPADKTTEPEKAETKAETKAESGTENPAEKLIFGKYKSIEDAEKGYKEAEKAITRSAELEKQLKAYREKEEQARQTEQNNARQAGLNDAEEQKLDVSVKNYEFGLCVDALGATLTGEKYREAYGHLLRYQATLNPRDLAMAKACFAPETIAEIAGKTALFKQQASERYRDYKRAKQLHDAKTKVAAFSRETGDWLNPKERQDIVGLAINLTGGAVDLNRVKELVDAVEAYAVKSYQAAESAKNENQQLQASLNAPAPSGNVTEAEHWFTREEYNRMSEEEFEANRDKIERQILLERQGKLKPMLT